MLEFTCAGQFSRLSLLQQFAKLVYFFSFQKMKQTTKKEFSLKCLEQPDMYQNDWLSLKHCTYRDCMANNDKESAPTPCRLWTATSTAKQRKEGFIRNANQNR